MGRERVQHSLLVESLLWFFFLLFGYGVFKQIANKEQLNDLELLRSEMFLTLFFLFFIIFRFINMKGRYKPALTSEIPQIQLIAAKFVHISMNFFLAGIGISGSGVGSLFWPGFKNGLLIESIIRVHELLFSSVIWLISLHILAAIHYRTQHDFVLSSLVTWIEEKR